jgi:hypothetical protein
MRLVACRSKSNGYLTVTTGIIRVNSCAFVAKKIDSATNGHECTRMASGAGPFHHLGRVYPRSSAAFQEDDSTDGRPRYWITPLRMA